MAEEITAAFLVRRPLHRQETQLASWLERVRPHRLLIL
jgi:hypothetical protein